MKYLTSVNFKHDIVFNSNREDHKKKFKVKTRRYTEENRRKPIYESANGHGRRIGYEKRKVVEKTFTIFEKDLIVNFSDMTIIVGDNGCGKSSFLKYLKLPDCQHTFSLNRTNDDVIREKILTFLDNKNVKLSFDKLPDFFVFENSIHKNSFIEAIRKDKAFVPPSDIVMMLDMKEHSNGETTIDFINSLTDLENSIIILDEPETSLSIKSQIRISKALKKLSKSNQLIVVTHSPIFMKLSKTVYDFEQKAYVSTEKYIESQYK